MRACLCARDLRLISVRRWRGSFRGGGGVHQMPDCIGSLRLIESGGVPDGRWNNVPWFGQPIEGRKMWEKSLYFKYIKEIKMASDNKQIRKKIYKGTGDDEVNFIWSEIKNREIEERGRGPFQSPCRRWKMQWFAVVLEVSTLGPGRVSAACVKMVFCSVLLQRRFKHMWHTCINVP